MKYDIIKSFKGSPDGRHAVQYNEGDKDVDLSNSLAEVALAEGWVKPSASEILEQGDAVTEESLTTEIADLEKALAAATKKNKPAIEAELTAKREALATLQDAATALREAAIATLEKEMAQLEVDYNTASEEDRAKIAEAAEAKQAELDVLLAE